MRRRKVATIFWLVFILICVALYLYIYTVPEITGALTETVTVEYGQMKISKNVQAVVVRDEYVVKADASGKTSYYVSNNTKTRNGIKVMDIYGNVNTPELCPQTGVVSYYIDGYENVLTPGAIAQINDLVPTSGAIEVQDVSTENIREGNPIYKLICSDTFYTVFNVSPEDEPLFVTGASVTLEFETDDVVAKIDQKIPVYEEPVPVVSADGELSSGGAIVSGAGIEIQAQPKVEGYIISAVTSKYCEGYDKIRCCNVDVVLRNDKGLIVPNSSIAEVDGFPGVYVKKIDGEYEFTRIKVINTDGENSVVSADSFSVLRDDGLTDTIQTISIYDVIMKDAQKY